MTDFSTWLRSLTQGFKPTPAPAPPAPPAPVVLPINAGFEVCLAEVIEHEGGYVDNPKDPGGATNLGITLDTLTASRGRPVTKQEVRDLTLAEANAIYRAKYWNVVQGDRLPPGLDLVMFDFAVNSGPGRAAKVLQSILRVTPDGGIGPVTLAAVEARRSEVKLLIVEVCEARLAFLRSLNTWGTFGKGWTSRVNAVKKVALGMS